LLAEELQSHRQRIAEGDLAAPVCRVDVGAEALQLQGDASAHFPSGTGGPAERHTVRRAARTGTGPKNLVMQLQLDNSDVSERPTADAAHVVTSLTSGHMTPVVPITGRVTLFVP
jgi:hypothetical protein